MFINTTLTEIRPLRNNGPTVKCHFFSFFSPTIHMTDTKVYNGENQRRDVETELTENNFHDILTNWTFSETKVPLCDTRSSRMPTGHV